MGKCCCCDSIPKKNWVWGWRMPPPGGKNQSSRGRRSGDEGGGPDLDLELCYHVTMGRGKVNCVYIGERQFGLHIHETHPKP